MRIKRIIGSSIVATVSTLGLFAGVGDASAAPRKDLGGGYFQVGPFPDTAACDADRIAQGANWNLGSSDCYPINDGGWYYTGRMGA